jgi:hypothetical protein
MNLSEMITLVRRDLKDDSSPYQWSGEELTRHINRGLKRAIGKVAPPG